MSNTNNEQPDEVSLNILIKNKISIFSREIYFELFAQIITDTYLSSSFSRKKDIFRPKSKNKKNLWVEVCKSIYRIDYKYSASRLVIKYLMFYCSIIVNKLLVFSWNHKQDLGLILKLYLRICEEEIELKHAKSVFRSIVQGPRTIDQKLSRNLLSDLWKKAIQSKLGTNSNSNGINNTTTNLFNINNTKEDIQRTKDNKNNKAKIYYRYNVITPYIHPSSINPIDSDSLSQRLNENFELLRFKKIHLRDEIKQYNDQYDPLIKKNRKPFKLLTPKYETVKSVILCKSKSQQQLKGYSYYNKEKEKRQKGTLSTPKLFLNHNGSLGLFSNNQDKAVNKTDKAGNKVRTVRTIHVLSRNIQSMPRSANMRNIKTINTKQSNTKDSNLIPILLSNRRIMNYFSMNDLYY